MRSKTGPGYREAIQLQHKIRELREEYDYYRNCTSGLEPLSSYAEEISRRELAGPFEQGVHQVLSTTRRKLGNLVSTADSPLTQGLTQELNDLKELVEESFSGSCRMMLALNPRQLFESDLVSALNWLGEEFKEYTGINILIENRGIAKSPGKQIQVFLYRIVRDILLSALDSGAGAIRMALFSDDRYMKIDLEDDGATLDVSQIYEQGEGQREAKLYDIRNCIRKSDGFFHASNIKTRNRIMIVMPI